MGEDATVFLYVADITDATQVELAVIAANEFHQQTTDHVVCAASATVLGDVLNQDLLTMKRNMDVNYFGTLNVLKVLSGVFPLCLLWFMHSSRLHRALCLLWCSMMCAAGS